MATESDYPRFAVGDLVYHRADSEGETRGVVVAIVYYSKQIFYRVKWSGLDPDEHQDIELTSDLPLDGASPTHQA